MYRWHVHSSFIAEATETSKVDLCVKLNDICHTYVSKTDKEAKSHEVLVKQINKHMLDNDVNVTEYFQPTFKRQTISVRFAS